ncbi:MsnO8 family LLM class oxidoreductase [Virgibacillus salexigens]|uniref:Luciferase-like domain-containing protein n=1 Tax=Virgibacillus kapii TaxID=1638645 RepID=A0ABQ2DKE7_9BACI|nr:MsnO8 family LLM class oxidoreductase [Virgibacillus kapii]GGJ61344.1 hypothetical protein GCM10007111_24390 [Virgibacillus kapii]
MKLSILDQVPLLNHSSSKQAIQETLELAELADRLGYYRYWVAEHHDMPGLACPAPDMILSIIGSKTEKIRIGSGAVLLPHYRAFPVAERYNLLATMYPNRIDLGIGRAPGASAEAAIALSGNFLENVRDMPNLLDELLAFLNQSFLNNHMYSKVAPTPVPTTPSIPWLLGTSEKSAKLAAEKGMAYAFGHFMTDKDGPAILQSFKQQSSADTIVAVSVICAETNERAQELAQAALLWKMQQNNGEENAFVPTENEAKSHNYTNNQLDWIRKQKQKMIIGDPCDVRVELHNLAVTYQTNELMIITITPDYQSRKASYELIAEAVL